jgi:hypothetical protein
VRDAAVGALFANGAALCHAVEARVTARAGREVTLIEGGRAGGD